MENDKEKWYFTFMMRQADLRNKFVCIEGRFSEARAEMAERFGDQWAMQYSEKDFEGQPEEFGLKELL